MKFGELPEGFKRKVGAREDFVGGIPGDGRRNHFDGTVFRKRGHEFFQHGRKSEAVRARVGKEVMNDDGFARHGHGRTHQKVVLAGNGGSVGRKGKGGERKSRSRSSQ